MNSNLYEYLNRNKLEDIQDKEIKDIIDLQIECDTCQITELYFQLIFSLEPYRAPHENTTKLNYYRMAMYFYNSLRADRNNPFYKYFNVEEYDKNHDSFRKSYKMDNITLYDIIYNDGAEFHKFIEEYKDETIILED